MDERFEVLGAADREVASSCKAQLERMRAALLHSVAEERLQWKDGLQGLSEKVDNLATELRQAENYVADMAVPATSADALRMAKATTEGRISGNEELLGESMDEEPDALQVEVMRASMHAGDGNNVQSDVQELLEFRTRIAETGQSWRATLEQTSRQLEAARARRLADEAEERALGEAFDASRRARRRPEQMAREHRARRHR